jgi:hypothetical protein
MKEKKYEAYEKAVRQVWADGSVSFDEKDMIEALRISLEITLEEHSEIESKIIHEIEESRKQGASKSTESAQPPKTSPEQIPVDDKEPTEPKSESTNGIGPIGDLSTEELTKDLDDLSKSIDKLGQKISMEPTVIKSRDSGIDEISPSGKEDDAEDTPQEQPEPAGNDITPPIETPSLFESRTSDTDTSESSDEDEASTSTTGSDMLEQLRQQYEQDKREEGPAEPPTEEAQAGASFGPEAPDISAEEDIEEWTVPSEEEEELVSLDDYLKAGKKASRDKDYNSAFKHYKTALEIDPENKEVKFFLKRTITAIKEMKGKPPEEGEEPPKPKKKKRKKIKAKTDDEDISEEGDKLSAESDSAPEAGFDEPKVSEDEIGLEVPTTTTTPKADGSSCASCGGSGICNWCKGSQKCYWCNGSGKCTKCEGAKEIDGKPCSFCNAEGTCSSCEGSGTCTWCKGTGKCTTCSE